MCLILLIVFARMQMHDPHTLHHTHTRSHTQRNFNVTTLGEACWTEGGEQRRKGKVFSAWQSKSTTTTINIGFTQGVQRYIAWRPTSSQTSTRTAAPFAWLLFPRKIASILLTSKTHASAQRRHAASGILRFQGILKMTRKCDWDNDLLRLAELFHKSKSMLLLILLLFFF